MGRLLERLLSDAESAPAAIPAIPAILEDSTGQESQNRKNRTGRESESEEATAQRARLLTLADDEGLPAGLVHGLADADATACAGLPDVALRAYLRALERRQRMDAGQVPPEWGKAVARSCEGCGPVLLWATCPAVVKACPWCFRRKAGRAIPRPLVACGDCRHYLPDTVNPEDGMGGCQLGPGRAYWPMKRHRCADMRPKGADSLLIAYSVEAEA